MKRFVRWLGGAGLMLAAAALVAGCVKSSEEENLIEFLEGNANEATFLAGVNADPSQAAKAHCSLYGKVAVLRDVDTAGSAWENWTTGSSPYLYHFDCL